MAAPNAIASPKQKPVDLPLLDVSAAFGSQIRPAPHYLFYYYVCGQNERSHNVRDEIGGGLDLPYWWTVWRPRNWPALPAGLRNLRFRLRLLFRWVLHRLHLFVGSGSGVLLIYDHRRVVHYSGFTPKYWRFPFVADADFQIGDTWTEPAYRKKGARVLRATEDRCDVSEARAPVVVRRRRCQCAVDPGCGKAAIHAGGRGYLGEAAGAQACGCLCNSERTTALDGGSSRRRAG